MSNGEAKSHGAPQSARVRATNEFCLNSSQPAKIPNAYVGQCKEMYRDVLVKPLDAVALHLQSPTFGG